MSYLNDLPPAERSMRARLAALVRHSQTDGREATAAARAASPGSDDYWLAKVDPGRVLDPKERAKRARNAKSAHFTRLALNSRRTRERHKGVQE
jgi:hypothetical protein